MLRCKVFLLLHVVLLHFRNDFVDILRSPDIQPFSNIINDGVVFPTYTDRSVVIISRHDDYLLKSLASDHNFVASANLASATLWHKLGKLRKHTF
jgi:hypothetical protein